ncbi:MAG: hypothetical protein DRN81_03865 [Thermoproteota archaeon]|nr:MAG: hypothetical protein DRN81_03865 [Candidatus Korarchaeota archaeon]
MGMSSLDIYDFFMDMNKDGTFSPVSRLVYVNPRALVTAVYDGEHDAVDVEESEKTESFDLLPGQVEISTRSIWNSDGDFSHTYKVPAWVVMPYGMRPDTENNQQSQNRIERTSNQPFGMYSMPRVGDVVFAMGFKFSTSNSALTHYYVLGVMSSTSTTQPPPVDKEDFQIVHRSGASIRFNDTFSGGGTITTTGGSSGLEAMGGLTGNLTMVGNRTMMLAGRKYLPHGLLAKFGDPREPFRSLNIPTYSEAVTDGTYESLFANGTDQTYYDPITEEKMTSGEKFLSPPSTTDNIIPLSDNSLLLAQQGGGVLRIDDHNASDEYSRMTMSAASMSIMVGQEYQELGRAGKSTGLAVDGIGEGSEGAVGTGLDTFEIQHKSGTRITIDDNGAVNIYTEDPNATVIINTKEDSATIEIGEGINEVIRHGDKTYKKNAVGANVGFGSNMTIDSLGNPVPHYHDGHYHVAKSTQSKVLV